MEASLRPLLTKVDRRDSNLTCDTRGVSPVVVEEPRAGLPPSTQGQEDYLASSCAIIEIALSPTKERP